MADVVVASQDRYAVVILDKRFKKSEETRTSGFEDLASGSFP